VRAGGLADDSAKTGVYKSAAEEFPDCTERLKSGATSRSNVALIWARRDLRPTDPGQGSPHIRNRFSWDLFPPFQVVFGFDLQTEIRYEDACVPTERFGKKETS
jgi:hypothetical protein